MNASHGWLLDARTAWIVLAAWIVAVLLHGLARSAGEAKPDPVRENGPFGAGR